jgi:hypothetical protein
VGEAGEVHDALRPERRHRRAQLVIDALALRGEVELVELDLSLRS